MGTARVDTEEGTHALSSGAAPPRPSSPDDRPHPLQGSVTVWISVALVVARCVLHLSLEASRPNGGSAPAWEGNPMALESVLGRGPAVAREPAKIRLPLTRIH